MTVNLLHITALTIQGSEKLEGENAVLQNNLVDYGHVFALY